MWNTRQVDKNFCSIYKCKEEKKIKKKLFWYPRHISHIDSRIKYYYRIWISKLSNSRYTYTLSYIHCNVLHRKKKCRRLLFPSFRPLPIEKKKYIFANSKTVMQCHVILSSSESITPLLAQTHLNIYDLQRGVKLIFFISAPFIHSFFLIPMLYVYVLSLFSSIFTNAIFSIRMHAFFLKKMSGFAIVWRK